MQSLKYLLLILGLTCLQSLSAKVQDKCFEIELDKKKYEVRLTVKGEKRYQLILAKPALTQDFFCVDKEMLKCAGDDDSGNFELNKDKTKLKINYVTFGEPEGESMDFNFTQAPREFTLKTCP